MVSLRIMWSKENDKWYVTGQKTIKKEKNKDKKKRRRKKMRKTTNEENREDIG